MTNITLQEAIDLAHQVSISIDHEIAECARAEAAHRGSLGPMTDDRRTRRRSRVRGYRAWLRRWKSKHFMRRR